MKNTKNKHTHTIKDQIRGCLLGGAAGDALGYAVEFLGEDQIFARFGEQGITEYELHDGKAILSDDTQMTLFTAEACLRAWAIDQGASREILYDCATESYRDWLYTQEQTDRGDRDCASKLLDLPELYVRRAPGGTCLSALHQKPSKDFIREPINDSKGCGGIMRIAPLALLYRPGSTCASDQASLDYDGAYLSAITHGHPLGYMPSAVVTHIVSRILDARETMTLIEIVEEARDRMADVFPDNPYLPTLADMISRAIALSENQAPDIDNLHALGEGWVAEETLGIALYCALKYQDDFSKALITSVNHRGDSDSTGAVTGNILGAWIGCQAIENKWKEHLELSDVILDMADSISKMSYGDK